MYPSYRRYSGNQSHFPTCTCALSGLFLTLFFLFLCFWAFLPSGGWGAPRGLVICFREVTVRDPPSRAPSNESECPSLPKAVPCEPICKMEHPSPEQVSGY